MMVFGHRSVEVFADGLITKKGKQTEPTLGKSPTASSCLSRVCVFCFQIFWVGRRFAWLTSNGTRAPRGQSPSVSCYMRSPRARSWSAWICSYLRSPREGAQTMLCQLPGLRHVCKWGHSPQTPVLCSTGQQEGPLSKLLGQVLDNLPLP